MKCKKCKTPLPEGAKFCPECGKKQEPSQRRHKKRANGTGTISKLSGNRSKPWMARRNGVCIGTYATRTEAQKALEQLTDATVNEKFNLTFKQVYEKWLPEHERTVGKSAKDNYKAAFRHCAVLHDQKFRKLRHSDFQAVILELEEQEYSLSTCEKVMQLFGQLSAWAIREGLVLVNHSQFVSIVATTKRKRHVFTEADIQAVQESRNRAADIVLILLATGCRPEELFSAPLSNCADRYFIGGSKTDAGKNRVIAVAPLALDAYQKIKSNAKGDKLISGYQGNKTFNNFRKREFKALMQEIGRPDFTPYDCRHTFTTQAVRSGVDPQLLKRMLGHADLATTDKYYTHLEVGDILAAISQVDLKIAVGNKLVTHTPEARKQDKKTS